MTGELWPVPDVLAHLAGRWRVRRTVRDLASGDEGHFEGTTVFSPLPEGGLLHEEAGMFTWQGVTRPAERTLRFLRGVHRAGRTCASPTAAPSTAWT